MTPRVLPFVPQTAVYNVSSLLPIPNRSIYLLLTMPNPYEKEMKLLRKPLAKVETDEDPDFDNGPEDVSEEIFQIMEVSGNMIRIWKILDRKE
ncbi:hypothetical protein AVEN_170988-1 [Araneus ventricosus]|uniref:Uncharacterized protein n=1 Tax=Araneus ventricosus TaxID=182803 RepID=A0A4Y2GEF9_ARAVE|nr:hypothetical protein AVEN_170988-1 [Araneus ventricosus]